MASDIKLEILYYLTASDFEMEFNLSGCCSMRILTAKPTQQKELLINLAKAVDRSKVIIVAGKLFGSDSVVSIISNAIGSEPIEQPEYSKNTDEIVVMPSGATPLFNDDGVFSGCIITSGPQVIILLSDDRPTRHSVLKNTVYEYIKALGNKSVTNEETENLSLGKHEKEPEETEKQPVIPVAPSIIPTDITSEIPMSESVFEMPDEYEEIPPRKKKKHPVITTFICIFSAIALAIGGFAVYYFVYEPMVAESKYEELSVKNSFDLSKLNNDFFAVISVPGSDICYPVVNAGGNLSYYQTHLFDGTVNRFGTPYVKSSEKSTNTVIYGFSDKGGFGDFSLYLNAKDNGMLGSSPKISLQDSSSNTEYYSLFSIFTAEEATFDYTTLHFLDATEFAQFIDSAVLADVAEINITPTTDSEIITIICEEKEQSVIIMAYKENNVTSGD